MGMILFWGHGGQRCSKRDVRDGSEGNSIPMAFLRELAVVISR